MHHVTSRLSKVNISYIPYGNLEKEDQSMCGMSKRWGWGLAGEATAKFKTSGNFKHSVILKIHPRRGHEGPEGREDV